MSDDERAIGPLSNSVQDVGKEVEGPVSPFSVDGEVMEIEKVTDDQFVIADGHQLRRIELAPLFAAVEDEQAVRPDPPREPLFHTPLSNPLSYRLPINPDWFHEGLELLPSPLKMIRGESARAEPVSEPPLSCLLLQHTDLCRIQAVPEEVVDDGAELRVEGAVLHEEDLHIPLINEANLPEVLFGNRPGMFLE